MDPTEGGRRRSWTRFVLALTALGYGFVFTASLLTPIYAFGSGDWVISGINSAWPGAAAVMAAALIVALNRRYTRVAAGLFGAFLVTAVLAVPLFNGIWGGGMLVNGLIALALAWPELSIRSTASEAVSV